MSRPPLLRAVVLSLKGLRYLRLNPEKRPEPCTVVLMLVSDLSWSLNPEDRACSILPEAMEQEPPLPGAPAALMTGALAASFPE